MKTNFTKGTFALLLTCGLLNVTHAQQVSEEELKINVAKISNSTEQLKSLEPVVYDYDTNKFKKLELPSGKQYGFLASNMKEVFPNMVQASSKVYLSGKNASKVARYNEVDTESLIPVLVAAIKEQQEQIEALKKEVEQLKSKAE